MNIVQLCYMIGLLPVIVYAFIFIRFRKAWTDHIFPEVVNNKLPFISVIIPFRNEKNNLPELIAVLKNQKYPKNRYEVIAVDDHSTDGTPSLIAEHMQHSENICLLLNQGTGKKSAIKTAILKASGQLITTTDADCLPSSDWLQSIANCYNTTKPAMLVGPVKMVHQSTIFSRFQALDFLALQIAGAGASMHGSPVYCSAANLTFEKKAWQYAQSSLSGMQQKSGDDVFLLHTFKKLGLPIIFINDKNAMVVTKTEKTLKNFLKQRMRWGGKSTSYQDKFTITLAFTVLLTNLALLLLFIASFFFPECFLILFISFLAKTIVDYLLLKSGQKLFNQNISCGLYIVFSLFYPLYIVLTGLGGIILNPSWKGRK